MTALQELQDAWLDAARRALGGDMQPLRLRVQLGEMPIDEPAYDLPIEASFLTTKQVIHRYGISQQTLSRWLREGRRNFPRPQKLGQRSLFKKTELMHWEKSWVTVGGKVAE